MYVNMQNYITASTYSYTAFYLLIVTKTPESRRSQKPQDENSTQTVATLASTYSQIPWVRLLNCCLLFQGPSFYTGAPRAITFDKFKSGKLLLTHSWTVDLSDWLLPTDFLLRNATFEPIWGVVHRTRAKIVELVFLFISFIGPNQMLHQYVWTADS